MTSTKEHKFGVSPSRKGRQSPAAESPNGSEASSVRYPASKARICFKRGQSETKPSRKQAAEKLVKTAYCKHHFKGHCLYGDKCAFAHSASELVPRPNLSKTKICQNFRSGRCANNECIFAHGMDEMRQIRAKVNVPLRSPDFSTSELAHAQPYAPTRQPCVNAVAQGLPPPGLLKHSGSYSAHTDRRADNNVFSTAALLLALLQLHEIHSKQNPVAMQEDGPSQLQAEEIALRRFDRLTTEALPYVPTASVHQMARQATEVKEYATHQVPALLEVEQARRWSDGAQMLQMAQEGKVGSSMEEEHSEMDNHFPQNKSKGAHRQLRCVFEPRVVSDVLRASALESQVVGAKDNQVPQLPSFDRIRVQSVGHMHMIPEETQVGMETDVADEICDLLFGRIEALSL